MAHLMLPTLEHSENGISKTARTNGLMTLHNGQIQMAMALVITHQMVQHCLTSSLTTLQQLMIPTTMATQITGQN